MKKIEVTCGYREERENGHVTYYGGSTFNGTCYKDMDAFEKGEGVIYISEYNLLDYIAGEGCDMWTRETLLDEVRETLEDERLFEMRDNEKFVEFLARVVLETCDWQDLSTYLYELTYDDSIEEMYADRKLWDK